MCLDHQSSIGVRDGVIDTPEVLLITAARSLPLATGLHVMGRTFRRVGALIVPKDLLRGQTKPGTDARLVLLRSQEDLMRTVTFAGIAALVLLVVLTTSLQRTGWMRCHMTQDLMPVACCAVASNPEPTPAVISAPLCCEAINQPFPTAVATTTTAGKSSTAVPPERVISRRDHDDHDLRASVRNRQMSGGHHSFTTTRYRPAYEQYCSYLL